MEADVWRRGDRGTFPMERGPHPQCDVDPRQTLLSSDLGLGSWQSCDWFGLQGTDEAKERRQHKQVTSHI